MPTPTDGAFGHPSLQRPTSKQKSANCAKKNCVMNKTQISLFELDDVDAPRATPSHPTLAGRHTTLL